MSPEYIATLRAVVQRQREHMMTHPGEHGETTDPLAEGLADALDAVERVQAFAKTLHQREATADEAGESGWSPSLEPLIEELEAAIAGPPTGTLIVGERIGDRYARFCANATRGRMFVNEYGRRSEIVCECEGYHYRNIPHDGPMFYVVVHWADAQWTNERMPWWTIGEPEVAQ